MWIPIKPLRRAQPVEVEQFYVRIAFWVIGLSFTFWVYRWNTTALKAVVVLDTLIIAGLTAHLVLRPQPSPRRVVAGVVLDQLCIVAMLAVCDERLAFLFFMSATASVGYGLRFGSRYAALSAVVGGVMLSLLTVFNPIYRANLHWMVALISTVSLGPLYSAYLSRRLERMREAERRAAKTLHFKNTHDALTGLYNKPYFVAALGKALRGAENRRLGVGVLFIDLDGFKAVNDCHGHAAGDLVLRRTAQNLRQSVRSEDMVARHSGDEFLVLLRNVLSEQEVRLTAAKVRERLRDSIRGIDASIGAACYLGAGPPPSPEAIIKRADTAMYAIKHARRDEPKVVPLPARVR